MEAPIPHWCDSRARHAFPKSSGDERSERKSANVNVSRVCDIVNLYVTNSSVILAGRNTTIKCENMKRLLGTRVPVIVKLCALIIMVTQNVSAYPYRLKQNERNAVQFPGTLSKIDSGRTRSELDEIIEKTFENNDTSGSGTKRQRDTSRYEENEDFTSRSSTRSRIKAQDRMYMDTKFVFPEEINQVPTCKGSTFCENVGFYPEDLVNQAIERNESLKYFAGVDVVTDIAQRIDVTDDVPLCVSTEQVIFPQSAENKDKEWKYIANQDNFKQGVRIERCSKESNSCSVIGGLAEGYRTTCKQKYVYRQLAAVQSDGKIIPDTFRFPSSCCCHVSFSGHPLTRMGINIVEQRSQMTPIKARRRK